MLHHGLWIDGLHDGDWEGMEVTEHFGKPCRLCGDESGKRGELNWRNTLDALPVFFVGECQQHDMQSLST